MKNLFSKVGYLDEGKTNQKDKFVNMNEYSMSFAM